MKQTLLLILFTLFLYVPTTCMESSPCENIPDDIILLIAIVTKNKHVYSLINKRCHALITQKNVLFKFPRFLNKKEHMCFMVKSAKANDIFLFKHGLKTAPLCNHNWLNIVSHFIHKKSDTYILLKEFNNFLKKIPTAEYPDNLLSHVMGIYRGDKYYRNEYINNYTTLKKNEKTLLTPLHVAADLNHKTIAILLLIQNPTLLNKRSFHNNTDYSNSPLEIAIQMNYTSLCKLFFSYSTIELNSKTNNLSLLEWTCQYAKEATLKCIIKNLIKKFPTTYRTLFTPVALDFAIQKNTVFLFLDTIKYKLIGDEQPLHIAAKYPNKQLIYTLCDHPNTDINQARANGNTPLIIATFYNNYDAVKILLEKGADYSKKNQRNENALNHAFDENIKNLLIDCSNKKNELQ